MWEKWPSRYQKAVQWVGAQLVGRREYKEDTIQHTLQGVCQHLTGGLVLTTYPQRGL